VQFHELGGWDTVVDCVAAAWLVNALGRPSWSLGPLPLGGGTVETAHGRLPIPAPATLRLLEGFALRDDGISGERVTPTGAAILHYLKPTQTWMAPALRLAGTGYGLGTRELGGIPNLLRALFFQRSDSLIADESIGIIRCEVDDQTAEDLAYALERLRTGPGVRDVCYWTAVGKQGRMVAAIQILCDPDVLHQVALACLNETSTIGVRTAVETRRVLPREMEVTQVDGRPVAIKRVTRPGGTQTSKIEFASLAESGGDFAERARIRRMAEGTSLEESS
jgi:pyridinium-3,5-bisthiocarboxylic acid mononucleotide nickel chelatase